LDVARFTPQPAIPGAAQAAIAGHGEISVSKSPRPASPKRHSGSAAIRLHRPRRRAKPARNRRRMDIVKILIK
jgi:hypothetical protein